MDVSEHRLISITPALKKLRVLSAMESLVIDPESESRTINSVSEMPVSNSCHRLSERAAANFTAVHKLKSKNKELDELDEADLPKNPTALSYLTRDQHCSSNFSQLLGAGRFGSVYKGNFGDGTLIAVKKLQRVLPQGEKEFITEVNTSGSMRHRNLVRLCGDCSKGSHGLVVYEFMKNGSLDKWILAPNHCKDGAVDWPTRYNIALGTAYSHEQFRNCIIHCDIKLESILKDENFCPGYSPRVKLTVRLRGMLRGALQLHDSLEKCDCVVSVQIYVPSHQSNTQRTPNFSDTLVKSLETEITSEQNLGARIGELDESSKAVRQLLEPLAYSSFNEVRFIKNGSDLYYDLKPRDCVEQVSVIRLRGRVWESTVRDVLPLDFFQKSESMDLFIYTPRYQRIGGRYMQGQGYYDHADAGAYAALGMLKQLDVSSAYITPTSFQNGLKYNLLGSYILRELNKRLRGTVLKQAVVCQKLQFGDLLQIGLENSLFSGCTEQSVKGVVLKQKMVRTVQLDNSFRFIYMPIISMKRRHDFAIWPGDYNNFKDHREDDYTDEFIYIPVSSMKRLHVLGQGQGDCDDCENDEDDDYTDEFIYIPISSLKLHPLGQRRGDGNCDGGEDDREENNDDAVQPSAVTQNPSTSPAIQIVQPPAEDIETRHAKKKDKKQSHHDNHSLSFIMSFSLTASSLMLCLLPLISNDKEMPGMFLLLEPPNTVFLSISLMLAATASLLSLETMPRRPKFARSCGILAILSLFIAVALLMSPSLLRPI